MKKFCATLMGTVLAFYFIACQPPRQAKATPEREMIALTQELKEHSHLKNPNFYLIGNGALGLLEDSDSNCDEDINSFLKSIDAIFVESTFFGGDMADGQETDHDTTTYIEFLAGKARRAGVPVWNLDYCSETENIGKALFRSSAAGFIGMTSARRGLDEIPIQAPPRENHSDVITLHDVKNFLVLLNNGEFKNRDKFLAELQKTNYDVLIIDRYFGNQAFTFDEIASLKRKANGGKRLIFAYMSVGEAENYRAYWKKDWGRNPPNWLAEENPNWDGNYKVNYWSREWKKILYGNPEAYLDGILAAGFDGAFLDVMDAWYYFSRK